MKWSETTTLSASVYIGIGRQQRRYSIDDFWRRGALRVGVRLFASWTAQVPAPVPAAVVAAAASATTFREAPTAPTAGCSEAAHDSDAGPRRTSTLAWDVVKCCVADTPALIPLAMASILSLPVASFSLPPLPGLACGSDGLAESYNGNAFWGVEGDRALIGSPPATTNSCCHVQKTNRQYPSYYYRV